MTRALPSSRFKTAHNFSALLLLASTFALTGCYTQLKGTGDRYGYTGRYHEPRLVHTDTVRQAPPVQQAAPQQEAPKTIAKSEVTYDTVMKGDTMFINERTRADYTQTQTQPVNTAETIINNYYGGYEPYDDYWWHAGRPRVVVAVTFGYPYSYWYPHHYWHSYYSPWYDYGYYPSWWYGPSYAYYDPWYDPWYGYGFYPPLYDAYSPYYGYGGYYGRHHGYDRNGYGGGYYGGVRTGRVPNYGRFNTGEKHGLVVAGNGNTPANSAPRLASPTYVVTSNPQVINQGQVVARDVPVHNTVPDRDGTVRIAEPTGAVVERNGAQAAGESNARTVRTDVSQSTQAPSNPNVISTTQVSTPDRHIVVVRRRAPEPNASYSTPNAASSNNGYHPATRVENNSDARASAPRNEPTRERAAESRPAESSHNSDTHVSSGDSQAASSGHGDSGRGESRGESRGGEERGGGDGPRRSR
jgi:hypothetical protein